MGNVEGAAQAIADALAPTQQSPSARWRWGTVASVQDDGTITATVGGTTVEGIRAAQQAMGAAAGDRVRICYIGTEAFADSLRASSKLIRLPSIEAGSLALGSPLTVANGGTGATTVSGARSNLNVVGASDQSRQNARFITYVGADQIYGLYATCINANNAGFNGKEVGVIFRNGGISLYNGTDKNFPWQISGLSGNVNLGVTTPTFTANTTNWTASDTYVKRSGRVVSVSLAGQAKAGVGTWQTNTYHIGTLSDHPSATKLFTAVAQISSAFTAFIGKIDTNGKIYLRTAGTAIPANSYVWLDCTFICS